MKKILTLGLIIISVTVASAQQVIWKKEQLMPTSEMAEKIKTNAKDKPLLFNVGPMENIKTAVLEW